MMFRTLARLDIIAFKRRGPEKTDIYEFSPQEVIHNIGRSEYPKRNSLYLDTFKRGCCLTGTTSQDTRVFLLKDAW